MTAISSQPSNVETVSGSHRLFTWRTKQLLKISELLDGCEDDNVLLGVKSYVSEEPEFSLEEGHLSGGTGSVP